MIFDVEIFKNYFICAVRLICSNGTIHNHLFRINERDRARKAFLRSNCMYVGHNSIGFDNPVIACWLDGANEAQLKELNDFMIMEIIAQDPKVIDWIAENLSTYEFMKFGNIRRESKLNRKALIRMGWFNRLDVDTFILGEKNGSLKNAAINLGFVDLSEAPVEWDQVLSEFEMLMVDDYCWHDIDVTEKLVDHYEQTIQVRKTFFDQDIPEAYSVGSAKLAELYLCKKYEAIIGAGKFVEWKRRAYEQAKKHAPTDKVKNLLRDYEFAFKDKGFQKLFNKIIDCDFIYASAETESAESQEAPKSSKMTDPSAFRDTDGMRWSKDNLIITDDRGMEYQFGSGGLHNLAPRGVWKETNEHCIFNTDASSMYPSLVVKNGYAPRQFKELVGILGDLLKKRLALKKAKKKVEEQALKLVLNSCFGKFNERKSILFDPKACFSVTLSGQLLLMTLIDMVYQVSEDTRVINANTDGVCFYVPKRDLPVIEAVIKLFQIKSKLGMENEFYSIWSQQACNLYCALTDDGKIKSKGSGFKERPTAMRETMMESSAVKQMAIQCLLYGKHPTATIESVKLEDFCMSAGFGGKRILVVDGLPQKSRRALRYAWVVNGSILQKHEARGVSVVGENRKCQVVDDMRALESANIDRAYYITKAMIKVLEIVGTHTTNNLPAKVLKDISGAFEEWFKGVAKAQGSFL